VGSSHIATQPDRIERQNVTVMERSTVEGRGNR
jgi:hypothetical protein